MERFNYHYKDFWGHWKRGYVMATNKKQAWDKTVDLLRGKYWAGLVVTKDIKRKKPL